MAQTYDSSVDRKVLLRNEPLNLRIFALILFDPIGKRVDFDGEQDSIDDILGEERAEDAERVALRTQLINRPLDPVAAAMPKILQFFAQDPNRTALVERRMAGIIVENTGEGEKMEETPLFLLNVDEVWNLAHGDGFATEVVEEDAFVERSRARRPAAKREKGEK